MFFKSIIAAAAMIGAITVACAADISGAGATFPFPIYAKWADAYKKDTGNGLNYQSIGSGAGIKQIQRQNRDLRRDRRAAGGQGPRQGRACPVADGDGGHRDGRQHPGREARRARARRPDGRPDLYGQDHQMERSGDQEAQSKPQSARSRHREHPPRRRLGHHLQLHLLLVAVSPEWESSIGKATTVEWPTGIGAKGNDGVANNVATTPGAIGYVEFAYAEQNKLDLHQHDQQGWQDGRPDHGRFPGCGRQRRLAMCRVSIKSWPISPATSPGR